MYDPPSTDSAKFGSNFFVATDRGDSFRSNSFERAASSTLGCQRLSSPQGLTANTNDNEVSDFAIQSVLLYNRRLSDSEAASVESWLNPQLSCPAGQQFSSEFFGCIPCPKGTYKSDTRTWSPSMLPSLKLWLDASDSSTIDTSDGYVSQWRDKSGNSFHAAQTDVTKRPLVSNSSIVFSSSSYMSGNMPSQTLPSGFQVTVVLKHAATAASSAAFPFTRCIGNVPAPFDYFSANIRAGDGNSQRYSANQFVSIESLKRTTVVSILMKDGLLRQYVNGVDGKSLVGSNFATGIADAAAKYFLATRADLGSQFLGNVYELILTPLLSLENRRALEIYLATKWGVLDFDFSATSACTPCPGGTFNPSEGAISSAACVVVSCPAGQLYSYAKSDCVSHPPITQGIVGYYTADTYNRTSLRWPDHSTSNAALHWTRDSIYTTALSQVTQLYVDPASRYIIGPSKSVLMFPDLILPKEYTLFFIAGYSGPTKGRIFNSLDNNWLSGFWTGISGTSYRGTCGWMAPSDIDVHGMSFFMATDRNNSFRSNGMERVDYGGPKSLIGCDSQGAYTLTRPLACK